MDDRTVHAGLPDGAQLVRYDRSGKWHIEYPPSAGRKRSRVNLATAARLATDSETKPGCFTALGRAGGTSFDAAVRRLRIARTKDTVSAPSSV